MDKRKLVGMIGCAALLLGVFAPIVKAPIIGSMNYFNNGKGDGVIIIALAVVSFIFLLTQFYKGLWITGLGALAFTLGALIKLQRKLGEMKSDLRVELEDNPFKDLADLAADSVQMQWGWALLIIGAAMIVAAASMKGPSGDSAPREKALP